MTARRGISDRQMMVSWKSNDQAIHPIPAALVQTEGWFSERVTEFSSARAPKAESIQPKILLLLLYFLCSKQDSRSWRLLKTPTLKSLTAIVHEFVIRLVREALYLPCQALPFSQKCSLCSYIIFSTSKQISPGVKQARNKIKFFLSSWHFLFMDTGNKKWQSKRPNPTSCRKDSYQDCREISCISF